MKMFSMTDKDNSPEKSLLKGEPGKKYRLVTRSDFDGLVCAILLKEMELISEIIFVHPKDMQDGKIQITGNDITTNLPYVPGCYLAFDHHESELFRNKDEDSNLHYVLEADAPSAARVVYNYFGGKEAFTNISDDMMVAVDKSDSAQFRMEDVLRPKGWEFLSFIMDARTGLGRFKSFTISNQQLMMNLIDECRNKTIDQILELPDVKERVDLYMSHQDKFEKQILRCATVYNNLVVLDLRYEETIYAVNRFAMYALFPQCNVSIHRIWGVNKEKNVFAVGKSIFNKTCEIDIGFLMLTYGGGGHSAAGTCQIENERADEVLEELIKELVEPV
jgi:nanoRNase/pAp phosphatase (c-di-AMP/oligoRNAs hydrolase)